MLLQNIISIKNFGITSACYSITIQKNVYFPRRVLTLTNTDSQSVADYCASIPQKAHGLIYIKIVQLLKAGEVTCNPALSNSVIILLYNVMVVL